MGKYKALFFSSLSKTVNGVFKFFDLLQSLGNIKVKGKAGKHPFCNFLHDLCAELRVI